MFVVTRFSTKSAAVLILTKEQETVFTKAVPLLLSIRGGVLGRYTRCFR